MLQKAKLLQWNHDILASQVPWLIESIHYLGNLMENFLQLCSKIIYSFQQLLREEVFQTPCPRMWRWSQTLYRQFWSDGSCDISVKHKHNEFIDASWKLAFWLKEEQKKCPFFFSPFGLVTFMFCVIPFDGFPWCR